MKREKIQRMFDSIAPGYDAFNHLASLGVDRCWRRRALREIVGPRVLDEACGTGDFAIAIAKYMEDLNRKGPKTEPVSGISVVGVDISERMLEVMRRKVAAAGLDVAAEVGDCCALRYPEASFDTVTVGFGMRNFEDREKALKEVLRVLRPGGRFVMLELGIPRNPLLRAVYKFYFTRIMPAVGAVISKDKAAYRYLPASVLAFPQPEEWTATMRKAGFAEVRHRSLSLGICNLFTGLRPEVFQ